jgi:dihydroflavonol-4-reductase
MSDPQNPGRVLVTGAGGFLGSHVVRALVADGRQVRAFVRRSTNIEGVANLPIEWAYGDINDAQAVSAAMAGCDSVIHCVVNTQAWLRDTAPMYRVNVDGLVVAMEAALAHGVKRFVTTSTIGTIGLNPSGRSTEADAFNFGKLAGGYLRSRAAGEDIFFDYVRERGLPGIAMNVANTYGPGDYMPTPHGRLLAAAAFGDLPFAIESGQACVGVEDAARAMVLAEEKGRIGERYIVSDRWLTYRELYGIAADQAGTRVKFRTMPIWLLYVLGFAADIVARIRNRDSQLSVEAARLSHLLPDMDSTKARRELGWTPRPVEESIRAAIDFYKGRRATE